jgi:hypothetical protein
MSQDTAAAAATEIQSGLRAAAQDLIAATDDADRLQAQGDEVERLSKSLPDRGSSAVTKPAYDSAQAVADLEKRLFDRSVESEQRMHERSLASEKRIDDRLAAAEKLAAQSHEEMHKVAEGFGQFMSRMEKLAADNMQGSSQAKADSTATSATDPAANAATDPAADTTIEPASDPKTVGFWKGFQNLFSDFFSWVGETFKTGGSFTKQTVKDVWGWGGRTTKGIWGWFCETVQYNWEAFKLSVKQDWAWLCKTTKGGWNWLCETVSGGWSWLGKAVKGTWNWLCESTKGAGSKIKEIAIGAKDGVCNLAKWTKRQVHENTALSLIVTFAGSAAVFYKVAGTTLLSITAPWVPFLGLSVYCAANGLFFTDKKEEPKLKVAA